MLPFVANHDASSPSSSHGVSTFRDYKDHHRGTNTPFSDRYTLNGVNHPKRYEKLRSFFALKDKTIDPRTFLQYHLKYHRRTRRFLWILIGISVLLFVFGYAPFFKLTEPRLQPTDSTNSNNKANTVPDDFGRRNQILLYRIIGNDLPPRHKEGQTLSNLLFILQNEPTFPNTRKIFVLNRITNPINEAAVIRLLDEHQMEYIRVPFETQVYEALDFRLEDFAEPDFFHSDDYRQYSKVAKLRALDYTYHDKNIYAMNNNGGRNMALEHAQSFDNARWIFPFDGNCFLTWNGFHEIKTQLDRHGETTKYFVIPMARLLNNSVLLNHLDERPKAQEEPQIIFRYDATERYNLSMRYGRRSKLELLWRLGALENRRLNRPTVPWEPFEPVYSKDKGNFRRAGWVFRLFSGNPQQEENKKEASSIRAFSRLLGIQSLLDTLDESIARRTFHQDQPFVFNETSMAHMRHAYWNREASVVALVDLLANHAADVLPVVQEQLSPAATTDHALPLPLREADYLEPLSHNVTLLTLACYYVGNEKYGHWAANLVRAYLLNEHALEEQDEFSTSHLVPAANDFIVDQGYAFPQLGRVPRRATSGGNGGLLTKTEWTRVDVTTLLDAVRMLRRWQFFTHREYLDLQRTMAELLQHLITSPTGIHLAQMNDHRGVLYDLQVTALASFTDDVPLFLRVANRCRMRIGKQFDANGIRPYPSSLASPLSLTQAQDTDFTHHDEMLHLWYWAMLAHGIQNTGIGKDIWHYTAKNGGRISHAVVTHLKKDAIHQEHMVSLARLANAAFAHSKQQTQDPGMVADKNWIAYQPPRLATMHLKDTMVQLWM